MIPAVKTASPEEKRQFDVDELSMHYPDFRQGYEAIKSDAPGRDYAIDALIEYCKRRSIDERRRLIEKYKKSNRYKTPEFKKLILSFYQKINKCMKADHYPKKIETAIERSTGDDGKMKPDSEIKTSDRIRVSNFVHSDDVMSVFEILSDRIECSDFGPWLSRHDRSTLRRLVKGGIEDPFDSYDELNRCAFARAFLFRCNPLANDLVEKLATKTPKDVARLYMDRLINRSGLGRYSGNPPKNTSHI